MNAASVSGSTKGHIDRTTSGDGGNSSSCRSSFQQKTLLSTLLVNVGVFVTTLLLYGFNHPEANHMLHIQEMAHASPLLCAKELDKNCPPAADLRLQEKLQVLKEEKENTRKQWKEFQRERATTLKELYKQIAQKEAQITDLLQKTVQAKLVAKNEENYEQERNRRQDGKANTDNAASMKDGLEFTNPDDHFTILPHELPGCTGFARPPYTLAPFFSIVAHNDASSSAKVGDSFSVNVHCHHDHCKNGGALFYLRAYGPAVLPEKTTDHDNGTYTLSVYPHDAGQCHYEAVLTFFKTPKVEQLPLPPKPGEPFYEGHMLPGFPVTFQVGTPREQQELQQMQRRQLEEGIVNPQQFMACAANDLLKTGVDTPLEKARWILTNKPRHNVTFETIKGTNYKTQDYLFWRGARIRSIPLAFK